MLVIAMLALQSFQPFNTSFPYSGQQDGKGSIETSFGCVTAGVTQLDASGNMQVIYAAFNGAGDFLWADSIHWDQSSEIFAIQDFDGGILLPDHQHIPPPPKTRWFGRLLPIARSCGPIPSTSPFRNGSPRRPRVPTAR